MVEQKKELKEHRDVTDTRVAFRLENGLYRSVVDRLYHGQPSQLLRQIFKSLQLKIEQGKFKEIIAFLYNEKSLTLEIKSDKKKEKK